MTNILEQIRNTLNENGIYAEEYWQDKELPNVYHITIDGDWKHSHLFTDHLMKGLSLNKIGETDLVEDGSDWYQSTHTYILC